MTPREINDFLQEDVIGQSEALRFVSVAIFKHLRGERFGNLMLIGNSGTVPASSLSRIHFPRRIGSVVSLSECAINQAGCVSMPARLGRLYGCGRRKSCSSSFKS